MGLVRGCLRLAVLDRNDGSVGDREHVLLVGSRGAGLKVCTSGYDFVRELFCESGHGCARRRMR
jgi:hypothetical protein